MTLNDSILAIIILIMLVYAIYDEFIQQLLKGKTLLKINLKRKHRVDAIIFIVLICIVIYTNIIRHGSSLTTYLLMITILMAIYLAFIRKPKLFFKQDGFYFANTFILYNRIKTMNLSEDGILIIGLEQKKINMQVTHLDDLQRIYEFLINHK
ncbi:MULTISPECIES: DUF986 family protein [Providencia]|uniref:UPF0266 membrane protein M998_0088 n=5 Tax=Providencia heimbachae TaxID=333962 RepID=A0A1B7K471_9GAMM|nr:MULTISPECIES: DUF986 family protein [Providencia]MBP6121379.1 DUF986 domain-containing protein [Providencia sp.]MDD9340795.1 DUF986 family protein [Providencia heimbachae]NIH22567.1 DUF986 domain-containing protein [Providencia heimbachae]OAT54939.1 hypothetical protein M998_0088 [Providencia heimbachae ATCC 35613]QCJ69930.1 DUF986 domain-containing protein [Providencia heimbachae]